MRYHEISMVRRPWQPTPGVRSILFLGGGDTTYQYGPLGLSATLDIFVYVTVCFISWLLLTDEASGGGPLPCVAVSWREAFGRGVDARAWNSPCEARSSALKDVS